MYKKKEKKKKRLIASIHLFHSHLLILACWYERSSLWALR